MNKKTAQFNAEFAKAKRKVLIRDSWQCQITKKMMKSYDILSHYGELTVDHIRRRSLGGSNDETNLVTLCVGCHTIFELMVNYEKEMRLHRLLKQKYGYQYEK